MPGHDIITIGASAGGVEALIALIGGLPSDLPAALFALRTIEDSAALARRMAMRAAERNQLHVRAHFEEKVRVAEERGALVRRALLGPGGGDGGSAGPLSVGPRPRRASQRLKG
ncbi:chemotaxis protein CheB [Sorangium sp. So ce1014]|uniref:chemotaxis protein CheB n=1 Tax=Sorangium sp. So ce1014 TaxID=3133326 RepID=UPI003F5FAA52